MGFANAGHDVPYVRTQDGVQELRDRCLSLADMPLAFPLVPRYEGRGIRHRVHGNYQIFYRVVGDPPARIDVLHVLHSARNYAALLFN
jgi:plasmid stabilization system protein ParE